jgi:phosphatidylglycerol:prolipoprotein diacylglycerol transferase
MIALFHSIFAPPRHLILLVVAMWVGLALAEKRTERHRLSGDALNSIVYYSIFGYIIGGRALYALSHFPAFLKSPLSLFSLNLDLFDSFGGLMAALVVGLVYGHRKKLLLWGTLDALTPLFAALAIGLSLAHLAAGIAFGSPTDAAWGVDLWGATRHPSQLYELIASLLIFGLIWFRKADLPPGVLFLGFTALTAAARLFLEAFRGDSLLIFGGFRLAQVTAWVILAVTLFASEFIRPVEKAD